MFRFPWIGHKLACTDVNALIADARLVINDREAVTLGAALTLSAHVLAREPGQLAHQLLGRLVSDHGATIATLLGELRASCRLAPAFGPYLTPPGAELRRFEGHSRVVRSVVVLPGGRLALSASWDQTLRLWDIETGAELRRFEGHSSWVMSVAVLPDGDRALSASADKTLRLWDIETGVELRRFEGHSDQVESVAVLPGGGSRTLRVRRSNTAFVGH